jgi:hypothetical protein
MTLALRTTPSAAVISTKDKTVVAACAGAAMPTAATVRERVNRARRGRMRRTMAASLRFTEGQPVSYRTVTNE